MRARILAVSFLAAGTASVGAQGPVAQDCDYTVMRQLPWSLLNVVDRSMHPDSAFVRMAERMATNQWSFLTDSILGEVAKDVHIPPAEGRVFVERMIELRSELQAVETSPDPQDARNRGIGVTLARFRVAPGPGGLYELFPGQTWRIDLRTINSSAARRALCWRAFTLSRMLSAYAGPARRSAVEALEKSEKKWDNFTEKGYSMYPWELALNSARFSATNQDPPRDQVVFFHPALSLELVAPSRDSLTQLRRMDAITIEPVGYLFYNDSRSAYIGISSLVSLPSNGRAGIGAMAHLGTYGKVGAIVWRAKGADGRRNRSLLLSADLYQFLASVPAKLSDAKRSALKAVTREKLLTVARPQ